MKKKFLSSILALAMVLVAMTPVMAEDYKPSPVVDGDVTVKPAAESVTNGNGEKIAVVSGKDAQIPEDAIGMLVFGPVEEQDKTSVDSARKSMPSNYEYKASFTLTPIDKNGQGDDDQSILSGGVSVTLSVTGAKKGDTYYALHVNADGSYDTLKNCTVSDGAVTVNGIDKCSPFILVKVTSSNSGSNSGTKVVTCEEAEGKGWVWSEAKKACVYSVTNTSTK